MGLIASVINPRNLDKRFENFPAYKNNDFTMLYIPKIDLAL